MALIDADDLMNELDVLADEAKTNKVWGRLEGLHYALDRLREASVIDAIPVEWLYDKRFRAAFVIGEQYDSRVAAINIVLELWRKEMEAKV